MKKFFTKIFMITIIICLIFLALSKYYTYCDLSDIDDTNKFERISDNVEVSNIGSSHGLYGFCYDDIEDISCFNFALTSQSYSYDYNIMMEYKDHFSEKGIMFIPISYFSLYFDEIRQDENFESKNKRYYKILSPQRIKHFSLQDYVLIKYFPVLYPNNFDKLYDVFRGNTENTFIETWNKAANDIDVNSDAVTAYERHVIKKETNGNMVVVKKEIDALYKIIRYCKSKEITPILITTPFLKEYTDQATDEFLTQFYDDIEQIKSDTNVLYYDYSKDERLWKEYDLFLNSDHLNQIGAKKFTAILFEEIVSQIKK